MRRLGYYLPKTNGTFDAKVLNPECNAETLAEMRELIHIVFNLQPIAFAFEAVLRNHGELRLTVDEHGDAVNADPARSTVPVPLALEGFVGAAQKLNNFLASATSFLTLAARQISALHGDESSAARAWNAHRNKLHAQHFAYQFLYELRNYAQHFGLPFSAINVSGARLRDELPLNFQTTVQMSRTELLNSGYKWKKLKAELERQAENFDLLPLAAEYLNIARLLCVSAFDLAETRLDACTAYFEAVRRLLDPPPGAVIVLFVGASPSPGFPPPHVEILPVQQLEWLIGMHKRLRGPIEHGSM